MVLEVLDMEDARGQRHHCIRSTQELLELLDAFRGRAPFVCELVSDHGFRVTIGIGGPTGFVQHSTAEGDIPYRVAVNPDVTDQSGIEVFTAGQTATEIPRRYCLPFDTVRELVLFFAETGARSPPPCCGKRSRLDGTAAKISCDRTSGAAPRMLGCSASLSMRIRRCAPGKDGWARVEAGGGLRQFGFRFLTQDSVRSVGELPSIRVRRCAPGVGGRARGSEALWILSGGTRKQGPATLRSRESNS
jgi:hypothetical protein